MLITDWLDDNTQTNTIILKRNLSVPSNVHGYSLAIEYMKHWFLKQFDDNYFKSVYIEGKHIMDDLSKFEKAQQTVREKPMLAIVPAVNPDWNRENLDLYLAGRDLILKRSTSYDKGFLQDYESNNFLGIRLRELEMTFTFKIRVGSRAEQLDLLEYMKLSYRVGSTQCEFVDADFHVPYEIMLNIAQDRGFEIYETKDGLLKVKDIEGYLSYLNSHSMLPFIYKFRTINGNSEFFIRLKELHFHISNLDTINIDDGERQGMYDNNFHLEMNVTFRMPVPHFYFYYTNKTLEESFKERNKLNGLYTIESFNIEPPMINDKGWRQFLYTDYVEEEKFIDRIHIRELLENENLMKVIENNVKIGLSPSMFVDIKLYNSQKEYNIKMDWENFDIIVDSKFDSITSRITIYVDLKYMNEQLITMQNIMDSRV